MTDLDPFTTALHADREFADLDDVAPAIRPSSTFTDGTGRRYRRSSHETTERFEAVIGALESGHAVAYASGMAAATAVIDLFRPDQVALPPVYHGVRDLVAGAESAGLLRTTHVDGLDSGDVHWIETPSNPHCAITSIEDAAKRNRNEGIVTVVDATFATPVGMDALELGADVVMHSATKAISGHSDALVGVLVVPDAGTAERLRQRRNITGAIPGSLDVWLALRGVRTLPLRFARASETAGRIAEWAQSEGVHTYYPGLADHPGHDVAAREMHGYGSVLAIDIADFGRASATVANTKVFRNATSLGGVESLIEHRIVSDPEMDPGLIRLSIGLESPEALIGDLELALDS